PPSIYPLSLHDALPILRMLWPWKLMSARVVVRSLASARRVASSKPASAAVFGLTSATFSQQIFVCGFGSSCSQPLLAKRPSWMRSEEHTSELQSRSDLV